MDNKEFVLTILAIVLVSYFFISLTVISGTLPQKYECEDLKLSGKKVISEMRIGFMFVAYNRCSVLHNGEYIGIYEYKISKLDANRDNGE